MNPINSIRSSNVKTLGKSWKVVEENREPAESVNRKECKSENDIRTVDCWGQSIDLALSVRGREALRAVGLEEVVVDHHGIAMRGRMIHNKNGSLKEILYDGVNQNCIYSVTRRYLNIVLLNAAEKYSEVSLHFNKKVVDADLDDGKLTILDTRTRKIEKAKADLIIGADGAYSIIRRTMAKKPRFNCSQTYIEHGYLELFVPSGKNNEFMMSNKHLHIWPRGEFMMIALPNDNCTFTVNLFAPFLTLDKLKTPQDLLNFCEEYFPDLVELIGRQKLVKDYFEREPKPLISIKCKPYHVGKTTLLLGDAAHAMVPFYAQGMNTGFEDVLLLDELMERYNSDFSKVLPKFSELRCEDAHAICDLAMYNYVEMRDLVRKKSFLVRKYIDTFLYKRIPKTWIPLYSTIHFSRMRFRDCIANKQWQDKVLRRTAWCTIFLIIAILMASFVQVSAKKSILY
ncbi:kynurenine 3-monooxygenase isoform X4 [Apis mellifera]|uniref:Kynurenine 3-monooxygenase isoform X4 n=1 Tax=Apis mellifera TaxID=7460 RepID=A0A7M7L3M6_APIME|nr:kynurenine 3-monooxygenase isoform X4 [Apis mellifera]|eukprot:XP_026296044.1 kynurenine 3-monooxygenase isoform X4 [Apis mellifera]